MFARFVRFRAECRTLPEDKWDVSAAADLRRWKYVIVLPFPYRHDKVEEIRVRYRLLYPEYHRSSQNSETVSKLPPLNLA